MLCSHKTVSELTYPWSYVLPCWTYSCEFWTLLILLSMMWNSSTTLWEFLWPTVLCMVMLVSYAQHSTMEHLYHPILVCCLSTWRNYLFELNLLVLIVMMHLCKIKRSEDFDQPRLDLNMMELCKHGWCYLKGVPLTAPEAGYFPYVHPSCARAV